MVDIIKDRLIALLPTLGTRVANVGSFDYISESEITQDLNLDMQPFHATDGLANTFTDIYLVQSYSRVLSENPAFCAWGTPVVCFNPADFDVWHGFNFCNQFYYFKDGEFVLEETCVNASEMDRENKEYFLDVFFKCIPELAPYRETTDIVYCGGSMDWAAASRAPLDIFGEVGRAIEHGNKNILFWNAEENFQPSPTALAQRAACFYADADVNFFFATAGLNATQIYNHYYNNCGFRTRMEPVSFFRFEEVCKTAIFKEHDKDLTHAVSLPYLTKPRDRKFLNFNRVPRLHRRLFMAHMEEADLIDYGYNSFDFRERLTDKVELAREDPGYDILTKYIMDSTGHRAGYRNLKKSYDKFLSRLPMQLNRTADRDNPVDIELEDIHYYRTSYFSIVSETNYFMDDITSQEYFPGIFYSEKIYKPFAMKHPFVLVGIPGSLEYLRKIGYKTFAPYIDETYDTVTDDIKRMEILITEIKRLCNLSDSEWVELQTQLKPIVEHNLEWLKQDKNLCANPEVLEKFRTQ